MVHYVFWLFSGGAPASQPKGGGGGEFPKPPSHPAARRSSFAFLALHCVQICSFVIFLRRHCAPRTVVLASI